MSLTPEGANHLLRACFQPEDVQGSHGHAIFSKRGLAKIALTNIGTRNRPGGASLRALAGIDSLQAGPRDSF